MDKYYYDLFCSYLGQYEVDNWHYHVDTLNSIMWEDEYKTNDYWDYAHNVHMYPGDI